MVASPVRRLGTAERRRAAALVALVVAASLALRMVGVQSFGVATGSMAPVLQAGDRFLIEKYSLDASVGYGDVVVVRLPVRRTADGRTLLAMLGERFGFMVKRVIGMPGQELAVVEGTLRLDGQAVPEPWLDAGMAAGQADVGPLRIPARGQRLERSATGRGWLLDDEPAAAGRLLQGWCRGFAAIGMDEHRARELFYGEVAVSADGRVVEDHFFVLGDVRGDSYDSRCLGFVPRSALVGRVFVIYAPGRDFWRRLLVLPGLAAPARRPGTR